MKYINLLKEHNLKVTPQRLVIVESLADKGHLNIDELYSILKSNFKNISLATIYKNIHIMDAESLIQEVKIPNQKSVYELTKQQHSHFVCTKCSHITDIKLDTDELEKQVKSATNFQVDNSSIVFNGICSECVA